LADPDVFPIPSDYELVDFVGSGDYGTVVKCRKRDTGETVAIKLIDFGLAFHASEAVVGSTHQLPYYR
uniref:Protein kinase domain-containing protein n=1 Tax=Seriola dumerili TaxID=41447 RepID=A0A3B4U490_SERDU